MEQDNKNMPLTIINVQAKLDQLSAYWRDLEAAGNARRAAADYHRQNLGKAALLSVACIVSLLLYRFGWSLGAPLAILILLAATIFSWRGGENLYRANHKLKNLLRQEEAINEALWGTQHPVTLQYQYDEYQDQYHVYVRYPSTDATEEISRTVYVGVIPEVDSLTF